MQKNNKIKLNQNQINIINLYKNYLNNYYLNKNNYISQNSIKHRITQLKFLINNPKSQYNKTDQPSLNHTLYLFTKFSNTLTTNKQKHTYLNLLIQITNNINK